MYDSGNNSLINALVSMLECNAGDATTFIASMDGSTITPLEAVMAVKAKSAEQAIDLLKEVFNITDRLKIAGTMKEAGYSREQIMEAMKIATNASVLNAKDKLIDVFELKIHILYAGPVGIGFKYYFIGSGNVYKLINKGASSSF